jgi:hypothetical protein
VKCEELIKNFTWVVGVYRDIGGSRIDFSNRNIVFSRYPVVYYCDPPGGLGARSWRLRMLREKGVELRKSTSA